VNPYFVEEPFFARGLGDPARPRRPVVNNWVFRAFRYTVEEIDRARTSS
jgi:hypothetical protein